MPESNGTTVKPKETNEIQGSETSPLVFISHDSRDAELAEAFSKLLKSVSTGMLKSFRSSDRLGTEGIQYGDEWYKRLMEKLKDASDVVCLFTQRSLNRPWILYEAGVAKGKLNTPVHGVALGVPLSEVATGPFYQFQNCQDDDEGLTGLVLQLLRRIPNAEPDQEAIQLQVQTFRKNIEELLARITNGDGQERREQADDGSSAAKLFEEVKVMVRDLPINLEERFASGFGSLRSRRMGRFHPGMLEDMIHMMGGKAGDPFLGILVAASLFRNDVPWLYDLGMEAYRTAKGSNDSEGKRALMDLRRAIKMTMRGPWMEEIMMMGGKETHMMLDMLSRTLEHTIERYLPADISDEHEAE